MSDKTNIQLISNVMLQSKYSKMPYFYVPWELLNKEERDARNHLYLSEHQKVQAQKHLWYAKYIENDDETVTILNDKGESIETISDEEFLSRIVKK